MSIFCGNKTNRHHKAKHMPGIAKREYYVIIRGGSVPAMCPITTAEIIIPFKTSIVLFLLFTNFSTSFDLLITFIHNFLSQIIPVQCLFHEVISGLTHIRQSITIFDCSFHSLGQTIRIPRFRYIASLPLFHKLR